MLSCGSRRIVAGLRGSLPTGRGASSRNRASDWREPFGGAAGSVLTERDASGDSKPGAASTDGRAIGAKRDSVVLVELIVSVFVPGTFAAATGSGISSAVCELVRGAAP